MVLTVFFRPEKKFKYILDPQNKFFFLYFVLNFTFLELQAYLQNSKILCFQLFLYNGLAVKFKTN